MNARSWTTLFATLALLAIPLTASAQGSTQSDGDVERTEYTFEKDDVEGTLAGPSEERYRGLLPDRLESLIEVRTDFTSRLQESVSDI